MANSKRAMKVKASSDAEVLTLTSATSARPQGLEQEHVCGDPKDGELCLSRVKAAEKLLEARRHSDVQIDVQTLVKGRKTNRIV